VLATSFGTKAELSSLVASLVRTEQPS